MIIKSILLTITCCFILGLSVNRNAQSVTLGYVDFPPYEFENNKQPDGILVIIVKKIFEEAGIPLQLKFYPFKRVYEYVKAGSDQVDGLFNFYKTDLRLNYFDYSEPIINNPLVFFIRKDTVFKYRTLSDLSGLKIGVIRGYTYGTVFDENTSFSRIPANSHIVNFRKLVLGRIDVYPCDKLVGIYMAMSDNLMRELIIYPTPLKIMDGHIGFTKGRHRETISRINPVILRMHRDGQIEEIINDYIENHIFTAHDSKYAKLNSDKRTGR